MNIATRLSVAAWRGSSTRGKNQAVADSKSRAASRVEYLFGYEKMIIKLRFDPGQEGLAYVKRERATSIRTWLDVCNDYFVRRHISWSAKMNDIDPSVWHQHAWERSVQCTYVNTPSPRTSSVEQAHTSPSRLLATCGTCLACVLW